MNDREKLVAQIHTTAQMLAGGAVSTPEHVFAAAVVEFTLVLKEKNDD